MIEKITEVAEKIDAEIVKGRNETIELARADTTRISLQKRVEGLKMSMIHFVRLWIDRITKSLVILQVFSLEDPVLDI